jgi:hypothetical protein
LIVCLTLSACADPGAFLPPPLRPELNLPNPNRPRTDDLDEPIDGSTPADTYGVLNALDYVRRNMTRDSIADLNAKNPGYNRRDQFGGWINDSGCLDTRGEVLVRSSDPSTRLTYKDSRKCAVIKGLWHDPYAGDDYKLAKAVQIDHVVPLKHVYLTGGRKWSPQRRCYYANYLHNDFHLLAVAGHENMAKADKSPEFYLPPNDAFQCEYVSDWMKVKMIWQLVSTSNEIAAIEEVIRTHHCSTSKMQMTQNELQAERDAIDSSVPSRCRDFDDLMWTRAKQTELPFAQ